MLEWLKRHAWKACIGQKPIPGSNPGLSAKIAASLLVAIFGFTGVGRGHSVSQSMKNHAAIPCGTVINGKLFVRIIYTATGGSNKQY